MTIDRSRFSDPVVMLLSPLASVQAGLEELLVGVLLADELLLECRVDELLEHEVGRWDKLLFSEVRVVDECVVLWVNDVSECYLGMNRSQESSPIVHSASAWRGTCSWRRP